MKGKRYTTEDKIRILREADRGDKSIADICREANISEVSFHRWKKQFGHMEINEARRLKELERENRGVVATRRLASGQAAHPTIATGRRTASAPDKAESHSARGFHGIADHGHTSWTCLDVGFHCRCDGAWRGAADADDSG
jgi:putative transposase